MKLDVQKRIAARILNTSPKRVWFDPEGLSEIKEAITKHDLISLINKGVIGLKPKRGVSRGRARKTLVQKRKGRRKGAGSRKGKETARNDPKENWMNRVRLQREFLKQLRQKSLISKETFRNLYRRSKGGFFRSKRHVKIFIEENDLFVKKK